MYSNSRQLILGNAFGKVLTTEILLGDFSSTRKKGERFGSLSHELTHINCIHPAH